MASFENKMLKATISLTIFFLFIQFFPVFSEPVSSDGYERSAEFAVKKAQEMRLSEDPYWHTLLHYKPAGEGRYKSLIDDPKFFCAKNGKTDPDAELSATLKAFFSLPVEGERHATVRFPGRYEWLRRKLDLQTQDFPYDGDVEYSSLIKLLRPGSIYLVFPAGYMKNPASVFGHTLLLVETEGKPQLLANSISYGAITTLDVGVVYALLGLVGGFHGYYGFSPYYEKIKEYANMDMRDMWEYRFNFTEEERDRLLRHLLDMTGIYSNYYFISENCSYNLLFLIEAARPETKITQVVSGVVEPIATIKAMHSAGLYDNFVYRPSLFKRIETLKAYLNAEQNRYVKSLCTGKMTIKDFPFETANKETQAVIWELSAEYLQYLLNNGKISSEEYRPRYVEVLSERRKLGAIKYAAKTEIPKAPHTAHGSKKIAVGGGKDAGGSYIGFNYRLTAHEQLENSAGYSDNSQLLFFSVDGRLRPLTNEFYLKHALLADIISLPISDMYFFNSAVRVSFGLKSNAYKNDDENLALNLKFLYGASVKPVSWIQFYLMAGADAYFNREYDYYTDLPIGGETGFITTVGTWKNRIQAEIFQTPLDPPHFCIAFSADEEVSLSQNSALKAGCSFNINRGEYRPEWYFSINAFF
ncbi:DUF4105 domain-containing protein [Treponema parvum]|uniref:Lnb N-terminal periplasmic domain-containing protein n=1 Tax=Treponema parvum TaxID=138851 RepID=UPI001AEC3414|nr:DUF4105 domain-containing protein [Treponema parvum]QTQ15271.1 DUF4105 domain-containing protein [Treponema parvum]